MPCNVHTDFFDDSCQDCRKEYMEMKGVGDDNEQHPSEDGKEEKEKKKYKEFTEERAKKLFEEIMLQYLKSGSTDQEAAEKAKAVVSKQCAIREMQCWSWL